MSTGGEAGTGSAVSLEEVLSLSGQDWVAIPRISKLIPFGYRVYEDDPDVLEPVILELECLERAKTFLKQGHSLRVTAEWLTDVTGREISHQGLKKRVKSDRNRKTKSRSLKAWAEKYKKALLKAYKYDRRVGNSTKDYPDFMQDYLRENA